MIEELSKEIFKVATRLEVGLCGISVYIHYRVIYFIPCGIIIVHQKYLLP